MREQQKPFEAERLSLQEVCDKVEHECWEQENTRIQVSKSSLQQWAKGRKTKNAEKSWITPEEADVPIEYAIQTALQGHGFTLDCRQSDLVSLA